METCKKAWAMLKTWLRRAEKSDNYDGNDCKVLRDITKQMEAIEAQNPSDWTYCSDELPTENGHYYVTIRRVAPEDLGSNQRFVRILRFMDGEFKLPLHSPEAVREVLHEEAIAWMPMPEPAKCKHQCQSCTYQEYNVNFGLICCHRASMEGIEAMKEFYTPDEIIDDCPYYINEDDDRCHDFLGNKTRGTAGESYERGYIAYAKKMGYIKEGDDKE